MILRNYEVVIVSDGALTDEDNQKLISKFTDLIKKLGAKIESEAIWGRRNLAYEVKKKKSGIYQILFIQANGEIIEEFEKQMGYEEQILKYFLVSVDDLKKEQERFDLLKEDNLRNSKLITEVLGA